LDVTQDSATYCTGEREKNVKENLLISGESEEEFLELPALERERESG
jgi:hypothetical protein